MANLLNPQDFEHSDIWANYARASRRSDWYSFAEQYARYRIDYMKNEMKASMVAAYVSSSPQTVVNTPQSLNSDTSQQDTSGKQI